VCVREREKERQRELGSISSTFLRKAFMCPDPKRTKRQSSHQCLFALLGSASIKAACKMLMKLAQGEEEGDGGRKEGI